MRLRSSVLVAVVAAVSLSGCAKADPSVAAYVDGTKITSKQLDVAIAGVQGTLEDGQQVSTPAVLDALVHGVIAERIAATNDIAITDAQRDQALKGSNLEPLLAVPAAKAVAYDVIDQELVAAKLGAQPYLQQVGQQQVTVNPRYGVLDEQQKLIVSGQSGSLAEPSTPTPTP